MKITFKGMKLKAVKQTNGAYHLETEAGRYFIRVEEAPDGDRWIGQIWKHTNTFGGCEIVRNVVTKNDKLVRRKTARAMIRAVLEDYNKPVAVAASWPESMAARPSRYAKA